MDFRTKLFRQLIRRSKGFKKLESRNKISNTRKILCRLEEHELINR